LQGPMKSRGLAIAGVFAAVSSYLGASPATQLYVLVPSCVSGVCPFPNPPRDSVRTGDVVPLFVSAADASGIPDMAYQGTVHLSSSDPLVTLPANYTFTLADEGAHFFLGETVLRTIGPQTISVQDVTSGISGSVTITVLGPAAAIPTVTNLGKA